MTRGDSSDVGGVDADGSGLILVAVQQPSLPAYRVPVFAALTRRPGIDLRLFYNGGDSGPPNAASIGFDATFVPMRRFRVGPRELWWHGPQWRLASRRHADVLILSWNLHYVSLVPALLRARAAGVPTILWGHGYSKREGVWRKRLRDGVARLASALLFYDGETAQQFITAGWPSQRIFVAPNALDQRPIQTAQEHWRSREDALREFATSQRLRPGRTLVHVSRLDEDNGVDTLLEAVAGLLPRLPDLRLVIVGGGTREAALREQSQSLGLQHAVTFTGPIYDETTLAPWMMRADVFCYPRNVGLSLLHAFGYGLPVVIGDDRVSHNPEITALREGYNGLTFIAGDATNLADTLRRLLEETDLREQLSRGARETVTDVFTLERMVDGMEAAIRYCAAKSR